MEGCEVTRLSPEQMCLFGSRDKADNCDSAIAQCCDGGKQLFHAANY